MHESPNPSTSNFVPLQQTAEISRNHEVQFYSNEARFLAGLAFVESALEAGGAVVIVATESHRKSSSSAIAGTWSEYYRRHWTAALCPVGCCRVALDIHGKHRA